MIAAIADALRLDDAERAHLVDHHFEATGSPTRSRRQPTTKLRPSVQWALDSMTFAPAFVRNVRLDVLNENAMFRALYDVAYGGSGQPVNLARSTFLNSPVSEVFYDDRRTSADINVEILRTEAGRDTGNKGLRDLIGELSTCSDEFRRRLGSHNVRHHATGAKVVHHPVVGTLDFVDDTMDVIGAGGLNLMIHSAAPGSSSEQSLRLLSSWSAPAGARNAAPSTTTSTHRPGP